MKAWLTRVRAALKTLAQALTTKKAAGSPRHAVATAAHAVRSNAWIRALSWCGLMAIVTIAAPAHAALDGPTLLTNLKQLIFGPWGLVIGIIVCFIAIGGIPKWGIGWGIGMAMCAVVFFCVPGIMGVVQTSAQAIG